MKVNRFNENNEEYSIKKIEMSLDDMNDFEGWERCVNIVYDGRQTHIELDEMNKAFGDPCFQDDYSDDFYWILKYNDDMFSVSVNPHGEGSWVDVYLPEQENINYSTEIKEKIQLFLKNLYKEIDK